MGNVMNLDEMLSVLRQDRDRLREAIEKLERLARSQENVHRGLSLVRMRAQSRLGRPPGSKNKPKTLAACG